MNLGGQSQIADGDTVTVSGYTSPNSRTPHSATPATLSYQVCHRFRLHVHYSIQWK